MEKYLLEVKNLYKSFHGVSVLENIDFNLKAGEVHVLLGANGAGKSTLIKILCGAYTATQGNIFLNSEEVMIKNTHEGMAFGISVIYQEFNLNPYMTIVENIFLGREVTNHGLTNKKEMERKTRELLDILDMKVSPHEKVENLSVAGRQMIEILKALSMDVKILVLDEPTAALTEKETEGLFSLIEKLKAKGIGIIYISHRMNEIEKIGDRVTVLRDGKHVKTAYIKDTSRDELIRFIAGKNVEYDAKKEKRPAGEEVLRVHDIGDEKMVKSVSFSIKKGTVLGVSGLAGAGRTETAKMIIGALGKKKGTVYLGGKEVKLTSPHAAAENGIVYISEDRKDEGLVLMHSILENMFLPGLKKLLKFNLISRRDAKKTGHELVSRFSIKTKDLNSPCENLSGGNQQKVVIAKWIYKGANVYIFDEPTRGIDVGARDQIYDIMEELLDGGAAIIMISSDIAEILRMSDEIMIMHEGNVVKFLENDETVTQAIILDYAVGGSEGK